MTELKITIIISIIVGVIVAVMGLIVLIFKNTDLLHSYHTDKISKKNLMPFCIFSGSGLVITGLGIIIGEVLLWITQKPISLLFLAIGVILGIGFFIYATIKYNK